MANGLLFGAMLSGLGQGGMSVIEQMQKEEQARQQAAAEHEKWKRQALLTSAMEDRRDARAEASQRGQDERLDRRLANDVNVAEARERAKAKAKAGSGSPITLLQDLGADTKMLASADTLVQNAADANKIDPEVASVALRRMVWEANGRPEELLPQVKGLGAKFGNTEEDARKLDAELRKARELVGATLERMAYGDKYKAVLEGDRTGNENVILEGAAAGTPGAIEAANRLGAAKTGIGGTTFAPTASAKLGAEVSREGREIDTQNKNLDRQIRLREKRISVLEKRRDDVTNREDRAKIDSEISALLDEIEQLNTSGIQGAPAAPSRAPARSAYKDDLDRILQGN